MHRLIAIWLVIFAFSFSPPHLCAAEVTGPLDLSTALALALLHNPRLASFSRGVRVLEAQEIQAGVLPNPSVRFELEDVGASGPFAGIGQAQATVSFGQLVELGGKRAARLGDARAGTALASWDYEQRRLDVLTATAQAFIEVLSQQQRVQLTREVVGLAEAVVKTVNERTQAGSSPRTELSKAEIALAGARIERDQAGRALHNARQQLAASWGSTRPTFERAAGNLEAVRALPSLDELEQRLERNPDLARWAAEISQRDAAVAVEKSRAVPDVTVGAGYRRLFGPDENTFVAEVSLPLPIFDRNQGAILAAQQRLAQAKDEQLAAASRLSASLTEAYDALAAAHLEIVALENEIMPAAEENFAAVRAGYREGRFSYLEVLDGQRTLVAARSQHLRALASYHQATAAIERLIGEPLQPASAGDAGMGGDHD